MKKEKRKVTVSESFVSKNIRKINKNLNSFNREQKLQITRILSKKFESFIALQKNRDLLCKRFSTFNYTRSKIVEIANTYGLYKRDVEKFLDTYLYTRVFDNFKSDFHADKIAKYILNETKTDERISKYVINDLKKIISSLIILIKNKGFSSDLNKIDYGLRIANEGDSAQFLFIARAILAGYNCSNVDVRSSKYDAIIDHEKKLIRVQVKGISPNGAVHFVTRTRSGQGINYKDEKHQEKKITSDDCDLFVAVDKQTGVCYIIPINDIETKFKNKKNISKSKLTSYLEKWTLISELP